MSAQAYSCKQERCTKDLLCKQETQYLQKQISFKKPTGRTSFLLRLEIAIFTNWRYGFKKRFLSEDFTNEEFIENLDTRTL